jgi:ketosteroid isomerase-like protein
MTTTPTRDLVRRYQDALNAGDFDALDDIVSPDIATPDILPGFGQGLEGVKAIARATGAGLAGLSRHDRRPGRRG